jgi:hypothetical protein
MFDLGRNMGLVYGRANTGVLHFVQDDDIFGKRLWEAPLGSAGYLCDWAVAKRLLTSSQLTVFHQAAR